VHKKLANLMCDLGFLVSENPRDSGLTNYHRIVKQTERHMIVVTYKVRRRLIRDPINAKEEYGEEIKREGVENEGFGQFLKKHGLVPPDMMGYDEEAIKKEYKEGMKVPNQALLDDEEDNTCFEIAIINKNNTALVTDCRVRMGEVQFDRFFLVPKDADEFVKEGIWFHKTMKKQKNKFYGVTHGPRFTFLSENLQNAMVEYLYAVGLRPELAMCVEYLSWNKEQRMYMAWLRDLYSRLFLEEGWAHK
jgi:hypothetical protein